MVSDQLPPPPANLTYPPAGSQLQFNYVDSFATSWVTPGFSQDPCFLSLYFYNSTSPGSPWTAIFNHTVSLNGTTVVPLNISSDGSGSLNLNYIDPVGRQTHLVGPIFDINYDETQQQAITWNKEALTTSTATSSSALAAASSTSSTFTAPSVPAVSDGTATKAPTRKSSSAHSAKIASVVLGCIIGVALTIAFVILCIRRRRRKRLPKPVIHEPPQAKIPTYYIPQAPQEKSSEARLPELMGEGGDRAWELGEGRKSQKMRPER